MNLIEKLMPHLIFVAALLPTFLLVAAAAISLAYPESLAIPAPVQAALVCAPCQAAPPQD